MQAEIAPAPGEHRIGLNLPGYGIHGTVAPASVFHFQSHGRIRLHRADVADLFARVH